jgi:hypothetical protein
MPLLLGDADTATSVRVGRALSEDGRRCRQVGLGYSKCLLYLNTLEIPTMGKSEVILDFLENRVKVDALQV